MQWKAAFVAKPWQVGGAPKMANLRVELTLVSGELREVSQPTLQQGSLTEQLSIEQRRGGTELMTRQLLAELHHPQVDQIDLWANLGSDEVWQTLAYYEQAEDNLVLTGGGRNGKELVGIG